MSIRRRLPSDHQYEVLDAAEQRDGMIRRYVHTRLPTLTAMKRRGWVDLHTDDDGHVTHATMTDTGRSAIIRARQLRDADQRDATDSRRGIAISMDPFDAVRAASPRETIPTF